MKLIHRRTSGLSLLLLLFSLNCVWGGASPLRTKNVVLVTLDGVRVHEMFRGMDPDLVKDKDSPLYQRFWAETDEERREKLMPFFWTVLMRREGSIAGNPRLNSRVRLANGHRFSYPGYSELLTGSAYDDVINSNAKRQNPFPTVLDFLQAKLKLSTNQIAAFGSWDVISAIVSHRAGGFPVNAGFDAFHHPSPVVQAWSRLQFETPTPWDSVRHDAYTFRFAMAFLREHRPRVLYLSLGETDDWAHDGRYDRVLEALYRTDQYLRQLWEFLQSHPQYRDKTTLLLSTDHGRGVTQEDWTDHGAKIAGAEDIWMAFIGPDYPRRGEWRDSKVLYLNQGAATLCQVLGLNLSADHPQAGAAIEGLLTE